VLLIVIILRVGELIFDFTMLIDHGFLGSVKGWNTRNNSKKSSNCDSKIGF